LNNFPSEINVNFILERTARYVGTFLDSLVH
jgi:hypothetical protein